jgi:hypothetical protein
MKAANHELKSVIRYFGIDEQHQLHVPLMALIDYRGFRLVAMSILPIGWTHTNYHMHHTITMLLQLHCTYWCTHQENTLFVMGLKMLEELSLQKIFS